MNVKHLGLAVGASAAVVLSSCSDSSSSKKVLTGPQTGTVTVNLDSEKVNFMQPAQIKMSGSALYDDVADTVTISLTLKNGSKSILHNPKALFSNLSEGTITGDGGFGPQPPSEGGAPTYVYFGPESIAPGSTATRDVVVDNVTGVDTMLTMDVDILVHPWFILPGGDDGVVATDSSGSGESVFINDVAEDTGFGGGGAPDAWTRADAKSPNGRYVYYTNRNQPAIVTYDTVDLSFTIGDSYMGGDIAHDGTGDVGFIDGLTQSPDGEHIYAVLSHGVHTYPFGSSMWPEPDEIEVLKLRATDLGVVERVTIWEPGPLPVGGPSGEVRGRRMVLTPDGSMGAVAIQNDGLVYLIDTSDLSVIDADDGTDGDQGFATTTFAPRIAAPSPDGSLIYVATNRLDTNDGTLEVIDVSDGSITTLAPDTVTVGNNMPTFLEFGPDGRLYYGRSYDSTVPGLSIYDPAGMSWTEIAGEMTAIAFRADAYYVWDDDAEEVRAFDYTDSELVFEATGATGLPNTDEAFGHGLVLTDED